MRSVSKGALSCCASRSYGFCDVFVGGCLLIAPQKARFGERRLSPQIPTNTGNRCCPNGGAMMLSGGSRGGRVRRQLANSWPSQFRERQPNALNEKQDGTHHSA